MGLTSEELAVARVAIARWRLTVRRPMLSERRAGTTLGDVKFTSDMIDANTAARGA